MFLFVAFSTEAAVYEVSLENSVFCVRHYASIIRWVILARNGSSRLLRLLEWLGGNMTATSICLDAPSCLVLEDCSYSILSSQVV